MSVFTIAAFFGILFRMFFCRDTIESYTQTSEVLTYEAEFQSTYTSEAAVQTVPPDPREFTLAECEDPSV